MYTYYSEQRYKPVINVIFIHIYIHMNLFSFADGKLLTITEYSASSKYIQRHNYKAGCNNKRFVGATRHKSYTIE